jgi:hypothetical protein
MITSLNKLQNVNKSNKQEPDTLSAVGKNITTLRSCLNEHAKCGYVCPFLCPYFIFKVTERYSIEFDTENLH